MRILFASSVFMRLKQTVFISALIRSKVAHLSMGTFWTENALKMNWLTTEIRHENETIVPMVVNCLNYYKFSSINLINHGT